MLLGNTVEVLLVYPELKSTGPSYELVKVSPTCSTLKFIIFENFL